MAKNLAAKGSLAAPLIIYNRTAARAHEFLSKNPNTVVATSVQEAVSKADIISTCVGDDAAIYDFVNASVASGSVNEQAFRRLLQAQAPPLPFQTRFRSTAHTSSLALSSVCPQWPRPAR
jgi:hypothetical protein